MNENIERKIKQLPKQSGVYIMRNNKNEVIYVGKAKILKNRVSQYFTHIQTIPKVKLMVENVFDFEYVITPSELDAFILENSLIKKYQPFFNILLKDGKQFPYIKVALKESFPTISVVRKIKDDGSKYFGPFYGAGKAQEIVNAINQAFMVRTCSLSLNESKPKKRECLNYSLGLCCAPCTNRISKKDYDLIIKKVINFLQGNEKEVIDILKNKMLIASEGENFETALLIRDQIKMVEELSKRVVVDLAKNQQCDVVSFVSDGKSSCANVLIVRNGKILGGKNYNLINASVEDSQTFETFILQFYNQEVLIPNTICLNNKNVDLALVQEALSKMKNKKVSVVCPVKGALKKLVEMSEKNAWDYLQKSLTAEKKKFDESIGALAQLKQVLALNELPNRMECYDISHIGGELKVGSMVVFENGVPARNQYRKFKIKTIEGSDDFACLQEVLTRRIAEYNKGEELSFSRRPDLLVIDGGKGQLSSVCEVLNGTSFGDVNIISLAKKQEEIFTPFSKTSILLPKGNLGLRILQNIRDEAHRFAITYHRTIRNAKEIKSSFDDIVGVGKVLKERLYKKFLSAENVRNKSVEELMEVEGISKEKAILILKQLC